jgi:hypothetical protein
MTKKFLYFLGAILLAFVVAIILAVLAIPIVIGGSTWVACCFYGALVNSEVPEPNY